jgi:transglutaminase-like putative cysteine protease
MVNNIKKFALKLWHVTETTVSKQELELNKVIWLAVGVGLASLPHWQRLAIWIPISHVSLLLARLYIPYKWPSLWTKQKNIINLVRLLLMVAGVVGVYSSYGSLAGRDVGVALLVLLAGFKIFESKSKRDFYISSYLGYFLIITNFFYTQTIPTATYMMFVVVIMTAGLIGFNDTEQQLTLLKRFKLSGTLLIQAIPILLILFLFFPRISGPLWGLPNDAYTGITGIDDKISPGTISNLVQSNEVAFRVKFEDDNIPSQSKLYWRGPILWQTDGLEWTTGEEHSRQEVSKIEFSGDPIHYDITIEPSNKKWLFGLEMVSELPKGTFFTPDLQLKTRKPILTRQAFSLTSYSNYRLNNEKNPELDRALLLPEHYHPKTREFARKLKNDFNEPSLILKATIDWLKKENFIYTLTPPIPTVDPVDEFLFNSKQGFCEHFASAFTVLMRAAGIPARIVIGYQGGEINPLGNYLIVRQRDAHAWVEVWLENRGWVRIDPTSISSPIRINEGINNAIPDVLIDIPLGLNKDSTALRVWHRLRNTIDMVNYQWAQWVLGYGPERQQMFMQYLGFGFIEWKTLTMYLFILLGIIVAAITFIIFKKSPKTTEPARKYYDIFCRKMARIELARSAHEGPIDFAERISTKRQDLENEIWNITNLYVLVRYKSDNNKLQNLKAAIKSFTPAKETRTTS